MESRDSLGRIKGKRKNLLWPFPFLDPHAVSASREWRDSDYHQIWPLIHISYSVDFETARIETLQVIGFEA